MGVGEVSDMWGCDPRVTCEGGVIRVTCGVGRGE